MSASLEQQRARKAMTFLEGKKGNRALEKLVPLAKSFPAHIMNNGLGAALAFVRTKKEGHYRLLDEALEKWLCDPACPVPWTQNKGQDLLRRLVNEDSVVYRAATQEALAYLGWFRRLAVSAGDQV